MGVKVYHNGNWVEFSTGSNASASFLVQDEGNDLVGLATALNFTGNAVVASNTTGDASTKKIHITGITSFLELDDTPISYVGAASSVVTVNSSEDGLQFLPANSSGLGKDNYVSSASFTSLPVGGGVSLTLGYTGPDNLSDISADLSFSTLGIGFTDLKDTPANFNGAADRFVKVNSASGGGSDGTALEFVSLVPSTAIGAAGNSKQIQFNDSSYLGGAGGLEFTKEDLSASTPPILILKPNNTTETYGGGRISVQSNDISSTINFPWNRVSITADGGLELFRSRTNSPSGGPYIDFKSQLDGNNFPVDMDARIQMDYDRDANAPNDIEPNGADYSAIVFETGGNGHYKTGNLGGRVTEKLRIGKFGEIGLNAGITRYDPTANPPIVDNQGANRLPEADIYGNPGEVLMSDGKGKTVYWGTNGAGNSLWTQNSAGIYRDSDVMIRRSDNANNASLAVHGVTNLSGNVNSSKTVLDLRNINDNSDCLTFRNIRLTQDNNTAPSWYSAAWRIQRRVDVTDQGYIQFGTGDNNPAGTFNSEIIFGNEDGEKLRITSYGDVGIGTTNPSAVVGVGNTAVLAVGIVSAYQFYGDGSNLTGISGGGGGSSDPVGTIVIWSGSVATIPSEYQLCDGSAASTSALQAITGANVPDLRDKFIVGANNVAAESAYPGVGIGSTGGSADATLPTHSHDKGTLAVTGGDHTHDYTFLLQNTGHGAGTSAYGRTTTNATTDSSGSLTMTVSGSTGSEGSSATNANLPPYYSLCYIIKHTATSGSGLGNAKQNTLQSLTTVTSSAFQTLATATITPVVSNSKILVISLGGARGNMNGSYQGFGRSNIFRGSTQIGVEMLHSNSGFSPLSQSIIDTNNHAGNPVTYSVKLRNSGSTAASATAAPGVSITLIEIV